MRPTRKGLLGVCAAATVLATVGACSSSGGGAGAKGAGGGAGRMYTIGVLTDVTGPAASANKTSIQGVRAGVVRAADDGYTIRYVVADTGTNPATTLTVAQKMVTRDHVFAVIAASSVTFAASNYLTAHRVPVIGVAQDGPEWATAKNMFSVIGAVQSTKVSDTVGKFFKMQGATTVGAVGYSISPTSSEEAEAAAASSKVAGLKVGYLNAKFPFGSTDVGPLAIAMKSAGVDGFTATTDPNTAYAMISALRGQQVDLKAALLATGYGGDLLQAGPGALNAAQNVFFFIPFEPVEMKTAATRQLQADLRAVGVTTEPTFATYSGYTSLDLLVQGLKGAGSRPTQASLIASLSAIHDFNAGGLYGTHKLDVNDRQNIVFGVDNCFWATRLEGNSFHLVPGADPICGQTIPGRTVSPSS